MKKVISFLIMAMIIYPTAQARDLEQSFNNSQNEREAQIRQSMDEYYGVNEKPVGWWDLADKNLCPFLKDSHKEFHINLLFNKGRMVSYPTGKRTHVRIRAIQTTSADLCYIKLSNNFICELNDAIVFDTLAFGPSNTGFRCFKGSTERNYLLVAKEPGL